MSEMSAALDKATKAVARMADSEGFALVGFAVPKEDLGDDFGWSLFSSLPKDKAHELTITIGEILKDTAQNKLLN